MSFILDALRKSETERQQQSSAEFAGVPTSSGSPRVPRWLWVLGLLLVVNLAVLLGLFLGPEGTPPALTSPPIKETRTAVADKPSFAEQVAEARQVAPSKPESDSAPASNREPAGPPAAAAAPASSAPATIPPRRSLALPTIFEVRTNGTIEIPDLHLDIHVYSDVPEDRFVFINMSKQRERSQLAEGPTVEEITPEGVILEYRGTSFLLPRD